MSISLFFSFTVTVTVTFFDEWRVTAKTTNYDKSLGPKLGKKLHFEPQIDHSNNGEKGQAQGLIRWDLQLTFNTFLT